MTTDTTVLATGQALEAQPLRPKRRGRGSLAGTIALVIAAIVWFLPFVLLITTSIRTGSDFLSGGPISWPKELTFQNFTDAWKVGNFSTTYRNSIIIAVVKVPLGVLISAMMAFALAKLRVRFKGAVLFSVVLGLTIPIYIALVPLFITIKDIGLIDNLFGLLGPYLAFGIPFEVLVLHSFFRGLPDEVLEAARMDGAGAWRMFFQIVLPLSKPALITVLILDAVSTWNELLMALTILSSDSRKTLPLGLLNFTGQFSTNYGGLAAAILIAVVPMLIAYGFLQRYIVSALTAGAVKG
ncbi:carbohydrate ABC transporter permease [Sinomonas terrae]|uniref:Carbohydrate ABC transporter permease n=1 Tax=Sinomonas terrae TaxID=2908838 RepID=A0ABS9U0X7_9MICC|nr:carbohydrate ABC transporter permease [Sinomonas terrae]MCH6470067.1 carbohydrate ABC transporter permease [Sinomonas terrae]